MQHGMHNMIDMLKYENELRDRKLKYHHLVADERVRHPRTGFFANLAEQFRMLLAPRPMISQERGV